jgi:membrane-associated protease RseP (regulator of RpoE activity)
MKLKHLPFLLVSFSLTGGIALAQQPAMPPAPPAEPAPLTQAFGNAFSIFVEGGFLGVNVEDIDKEKAARYGLRDARGVGITSVVAGSPAEKAGLRKDDVILRFDGENVTSARKLTRLVSEVAPDHSVRLTISRAGSEQDVAVTIGERKNFSNAGVWAGPRGGVWSLGDLKEGNLLKRHGDSFVFDLGSNRRIGISTMQLTKQLADYFGVADGKGVLVTSVTEDSPAAKAGIRAGDVITAVDGEKIDGSGDLTRGLNKKKEGDVSLTLIRNRSQMNVTVTPKAAVIPQVLSPAQSARRIVIPRIEIPAIPAINVSIPRIEMPVIPEITIQMPAKAGKAPKQPI